MAYKSTDKEKYAFTINGQILRITEASDLLATKVATLALKVPATTTARPTTVAEGTAAASLPSVTATSAIEDVAAALNGINVLTYLEKKTNNSGAALTGNQSLNAEEAVYVPVGYNKTAFTVTAKALGDLTYGTATPAMLIKDATALGSTGPITGSLVLDPDKILTTQSWTDATGSSVSGNIVTQTPSAIISGTSATANTMIVDVAVVEGTGETLVKGGTLPAGYYPNAVEIYPRFSQYETKGNRINIQNSVTATLANHSSVVPGTGYDYMAKVVVPDAATPSLSITDKATTNVTVSTTESSGYYPVTTSLTGKLTVGTAGWISTSGLSATDSSVTVGRVAKSTHDIAFADNTNYGGDTAITTDPTIITGQYVKDVRGKGYTHGDTTYLKVRDALGTLSSNITGTLTQTPVIAKHSDTNILASAATTTKSDAGKYYIAVNSAAKTSQITATSSCNLTTAGWIAAAPENATKTASVGAAASATTYIPITEGTHTIDTTVSTNGSTAAADKTSGNVALGSHYITCKTTTGYQEESTTYIDLGKSVLTPGTVTYNSTTKAFECAASTTAGYTAGQTNVAATSKTITVGSGATLTTTSATKSIAANTYYPSAASVTVASTAGTLADGTQSNANIGKATYADNSDAGATTKLEYLTQNTTFYGTPQTANGTNYKFFSSFTVEVSDIINALKAI